MGGSLTVPLEGPELALNLPQPNKYFFCLFSAWENLNVGWVQLHNRKRFFYHFFYIDKVKRPPLSAKIIVCYYMNMPCLITENSKICTIFLPIVERQECFFFFLDSGWMSSSCSLYVRRYSWSTMLCYILGTTLTQK